jgi:enterochelin esterase-like enzyme
VLIRNLIGVALALTACHATVALADEAGSQRSPRLAALVRQTAAGDARALAGFWQEMQGHGPLVEPIPGDDRHRLVTLLWRASDKTSRVTVMGGLPGANLLKPMARLAGTDVWYLSETHSTQARFQYVFQINGPETVSMEWRAMMREMEQYRPRVDPLNPREYSGWSYVELPDAPPQPWITKQPDVPAGREIKTKFRSPTLNAEYALKIYLPPGYDEDRRRSWLVITFDGAFRKMDVTLDNLLAAKKIPPVVVVGVENISDQTRMHDLNCSDEFAGFLATELVPWARKTYRVHADAAHTIVGGASLGGKMAAYCGLKYSNVFGKVLSQSGSFLTAIGEDSPRSVWDGETPGLLVKEFLRRPRLPLEFYLEVGRYETMLPFSHLLETRRMRDVLQAKGYRVTYSEFMGGHNEACWRGSFADAIMALTAAEKR